MRNKILVSVFYLAVSLLFFHRVLASPGLIIGGDWGLPETSSQMHAYAVQGSYMWRYNAESLFGLAASNLNDYPFRLFVGLLSDIGINGEIFAKFLLVFLFVLAGVSMYSYCRFLDLNELPSILGGLFFITTPIFFNYAIMGWQYVLLSIGLLPFALMTFTKSIKEQKISYAILTGLLFWVATIQSQSLIWYPICFVLLSLFIVSSRREGIYVIKSLTIIFLIIFLMSMSWVVPLLLQSNGITSWSASQSDVPLGQRLSYINFIRLWGSLYNYQYESSFPFSLLLVSFVPPILAFLSLLLRKNDRTVLFFVVLSFIPLLFFKGQAIYSNIPFTIVIRDASRFIVLSTLSYSVLIAITLDELTGRSSKTFFKAFRLGITSVLLCILTFFIILNSYPFWAGELYGTPKYSYDIRLRTVEFPSEYFAVENILAKEKSSSKALYLPTSGRLDLLNNTLFHGPYREIADIFATYASIPSVICTLNGRIGIAKDFAQALQSDINSNYSLGDSIRLSNLLNLANIKYVIVRLDTASPPGQPSMSEIAKKLKMETGFRKLYTNNSVIVFENTKVLPHIYPTTAPILINRSVDEMFNLLAYNEFPSGNLGVLFSGQQDAEQMQLIKNYKDTVMLTYTEKTFNISVINACYKPFAKPDGIPFFLPLDPCYQPFNWYTEGVTWFNFSNGEIVARSYIGFKAVVKTDGTEAGDTLSFPSLSAAPYNFPEYSSDGWNAYNSTLVFIKTTKPLMINGIYADDKVAEVTGVWWETGYAGMGNNISYPIWIPENQRVIIQINRISKNVSLSMLESNTQSSSEYNNMPPKIVFQKINPTRYDVKVENATQPFFLIFSESYDPGWKVYVNKNIQFNEITAEYPNSGVKEAKQETSFTLGDMFFFTNPLDDKYHLIANGYSNAWYINPKEIERDGNFTISLYFWPQSLFYLGLTISGITLTVCIVYLIYDWKKNKWGKKAKAKAMSKSSIS